MLVGRSRAAWRSGQGAGQGAVPGGPSGVRLSHLIPRSAVNFSARKVRTALGVSAVPSASSTGQIPASGMRTLTRNRIKRYKRVSFLRPKAVSHPKIAFRCRLLSSPGLWMGRLKWQAVAAGLAARQTQLLAAEHAACSRSELTKG